MSTEYYNIGKRKWLGISQTNIKADTLLLGKSRSILQSPLDLKCRELRAAVSRKKTEMKGMESCYYHMPWLLKLRPEPFEGRLKLLVEWGELLSIKLVEV